ncbi:hypothetical protein [Bacillus cereus]
MNPADYCYNRYNKGRKPIA